MRPVHRIALSSGEPSGIGPDLCIQLAQSQQQCEIVVLGDPDLLEARARQLGLPISIDLFDPAQTVHPSLAGQMTVLPVQLQQPVQAGLLNPENSAYVLNLIRLATEKTLHHVFDAIVTAPVHKGVINDAGISFSGHTEYIADIAGGHPVMMLSTPGLRIALATTHIPLAEVSAAITADTLNRVIKTLDADLRHFFNINTPEILVCGLNPHAGENGYLGHEEIETIEPALNFLRTQHIHLTGPLPADTAFTPDNLNQADVILAMYHDQGLPVLKHMGFGQAVNITLGLPVIRTSVDHGTALELAGTGKASVSSLQYAIETAIEMVNNKFQENHA